jgi:hypothetical protein
LNCTREFFAKRLRQLALELGLVTARGNRTVPDSRCADAWFTALCNDADATDAERLMARIDEGARWVSYAGYAQCKVDDLVATFLRLSMSHGSRKLAWRETTDAAKLQELALFRDTLRSGRIRSQLTNVLEGRAWDDDGSH